MDDSQRKQVCLEMIGLALKSLQSRLFTAVLTVLAVAMSVALLIGVERIREAARNGFSDTVSGIDLIVAARGDDLQILLATVFGIGSTANSVSWETYEEIRDLPNVAWAVPLALGDTHAGFPVVGTTPEYFDHYRYGKGRPLALKDGQMLIDDTDAVIGFEVASSLGYQVGMTIVNAHGGGEIETEVHSETPFTISAVLERTGSPVDRMVFVSLEGFAAIHSEDNESTLDPLSNTGLDMTTTDVDGATTNSMDQGHDDHEHARGSINAIYVGLTAPEAALAVQRYVGEFQAEPLTAAMPTATLFRLWSITSIAEASLRAVSAAVVLAGLFGLVVMFTATLDARRREFAILRSIGATPTYVAGLVLVEAMMVALAGILIGLLSLAVILPILTPVFTQKYGLTLVFSSLSSWEIGIIGFILIAALVASVIPASRVFRQTLSDGLSIRL
ncbi:ABC transporter permease [Pseudophaeobacter flagellatus]|uniref:ABC transporter permease n=1 Tax=Pseudophaeobacter flagellatus TaxID=2899119 RepID=UPI001E581FCF|nr:ABC transporter permease [Pseudophaeobacter flagellatus]MCD9149270.1 ABC transporter permease [Pseudophaeobacter flagellatus]